jgi:hypothetical protein
MKHMMFSVTGGTSVTFIPVGKRRKGLFASLLSVLKHSRRLQARRVIHQHRHLVERANQRRTHETGGL